VGEAAAHQEIRPRGQVIDERINAMKTKMVVVWAVVGSFAEPR
jgi:hypothetical protein